MAPSAATQTINTMIPIIVLTITIIFKYYSFRISFFLKDINRKNFPSDFCRFAQTFLCLTAPTPNRYPATVTAKNGEFKISWKSVNSNRKNTRKNKGLRSKIASLYKLAAPHGLSSTFACKGSFHYAHTLRAPVG